VERKNSKKHKPPGKGNGTWVEFPYTRYKNSVQGPKRKNLKKGGIRIHNQQKLRSGKIDMEVHGAEGPIQKQYWGMGEGDDRRKGRGYRIVVIVDISESRGECRE